MRTFCFWDAGIYVARILESFLPYQLVSDDLGSHFYLVHVPYDD